MRNLRTLRLFIVALFLPVLAACVTAGPAHGAGLGVGTGLLGTDPVGVGHLRYRGLLDRLLKAPGEGELLFGLALRETGFLDDHGLSTAFLGGGYRFGLGERESTRATSRYVTVLLMAFPDDPDDGVNVGGAISLGIQRGTTFSSGFPGGYFAEAGVVACQEFVTVLVQLGLFAGK